MRMECIYTSNSLSVKSCRKRKHRSSCQIYSSSFEKRKILMVCEMIQNDILAQMRKQYKDYVASSLKLFLQIVYSRLRELVDSYRISTF